LATEYRLLIDYDALRFIESCPRRDRHAIRGRLLGILNDPDRYADSQEPDLKGRLIDVHVFGRYVIHFWQDVNDRHIKILAVDLATGRHSR
jgi:hypothetical protein